MLYNLIMGGLDCLEDTLQYGPVEAVKINTSFCPQAERDYRRINAIAQKAIDEAFDKFENSEDGDGLSECEEREVMEGEEFADKMMGEIHHFMAGWMSTLYKTGSVTEVMEGDIDEG